MFKRSALLTLLTLSLLATPALAQYNPTAGYNNPSAAAEAEDASAADSRKPHAKRASKRSRKGAGGAVGISNTKSADTSSVKIDPRQRRRPVRRDRWGNAQGNQYDLAVDGAFEGQTVLVLHFYTGTDHGQPFDFKKPAAALKQKGFSTYRVINRAPSPAKLKKLLKKSNQIWIISGASQQLNKEHVKHIKRFFDAGHGVYLWGDNAPYFGDALIVAKALLNVDIKGPYKPGEQTIGIQKTPGDVGLRKNHPLTTGIQQLYEGHTIPTIIDRNQVMEPLIYGSGSHLVAATYNKDGKRLILDTGFTRLYLQWDTAGTARYVKNAAAWLANYERHGKKVLSKKLRKK